MRSAVRRSGKHHLNSKKATCRPAGGLFAVEKKKWEVFVEKLLIFRANSPIYIKSREIPVLLGACLQSRTARLVKAAACPQQDARDIRVRRKARQSGVVNCAGKLDKDG
jgi:hypothetical protein